MSEPENKDENGAVQSEVEQPTETVNPVVEIIEPEVVVEPEAEPVVETESVPEVTPVEEVNSTEPVAVEPAVSSDANPVAMMAAKYLPKKWQYTAGAIVAVVIVLVGVTYMMEQQGRINTGMFDAVNKIIATHKAVALVNEVKITQHDLDISVSQISAGAKAQGLDLEDAKVKADINSQALDMLVNTELLKQEAATRDIVVSDEDVAIRLESLTKDVGGIEVLQERMKEFNIDDQTLHRDIKNELTIQTLLGAVFLEKGVKVTDEEIAAFYKQAAGTSEDIPPLAEVRDQIAAQLKTSKEQEVVTSFVKELKDKATVEVLM